MKKTCLALIMILCMILLSGCEKGYTWEDEPNTDETESSGNSSGRDDTVVTDSMAGEFLTVAEAISAEQDEMIWVRGYIIGSTSRSIKNALYEPPFESRSSLLLADTRLAECDVLYVDELFPVCLTDYKRIQNELNLVDHPELWNRRIYIRGQKSTYMGMPGLRRIQEYILAN